MSQRPDPAQLAQAIQGLSDDQLKGEIERYGVDETLHAIFEGMEEYFLPERARGVEAVMQYDIVTAHGTKAWTVTVADGKCTTSEGAAESPRLTLEMALTDFVRLVLGQAEGPQLFMSGKLRLKGDMMFAMQMQNFFRRPGA